MIRLLSIVLCTALAAPVMAASDKEIDCGYQGEVVSAVQSARVARVSERKVEPHVMAQTATWPEKYNAVIPLVTPWIYGLKMAEVKAADLGAAWKEQCIAQ